MNINSISEEMFQKALPVIKKEIPIKIEGPFPIEKKIRTLENEEQKVPIGYYIVEGIEGEKYPISPDVFAEYIPYSAKDKNKYIKKRQKRHAFKVDFDGELITAQGETLFFSKGYYIIMESPSIMWPVEENIFRKTYEFIEN